MVMMLPYEVAYTLKLYNYKIFICMHIFIVKFSVQRYIKSTKHFIFLKKSNETLFLFFTFAFSFLRFYGYTTGESDSPNKSSLMED